MDENSIVTEVTGAEVQEPAEPVVEGGAEVQEPAEPVEPKKTADEAFAQLRREKEEAQRSKELLERQNKQMSDALGLFFNGGTVEEKAAQAIAYHEGRDVADVRAELERQEKENRLARENETLKNELVQMRARTSMESDLRAIQAIDPNVKTLDDLGEDFVNFVKGGLSGVDAYYALKSKQEREKIVPAQPPGKVNSTPQEKDYFTRDEVANMSQAEVKKHYDKIRASMNKW